MSSMNPIDLADHDLAALQEARDLLGRARQAAATLALWTPEEAKRVAKEVAAALLPRAEFYAEWAVRESRIGKVADKIAKNQIACTLTPNAWDKVALGGVRRSPYDLDLALAGMVLEKNGEIISTSCGASVQGSPVNSVAWLANTLGAFGISLKAGDVILSGSQSPLVPVKAGDSLHCSVGGLGGTSVRFV